MANVLVNFASGINYERKRKINTFSAKYIAKFDKIIEFDFDDLDSSFLKSNSEIFKIRKGLGLWLWKPYIISKALNMINDDDFLFYCDSSSVFIRPINEILDFMNYENIDFLSFALPFKESNWTSQGVMDYFKLSKNQMESNQVCASFLLLKKNLKNSEIISNWLTYCQDYRLITGKFSNIESSNLIEHRYDQSILSMIIKTKGINMYKDPSQYGNFPYLYAKKNKIYTEKCPKGKYKTSIILIRGGSLLRACLDYLFYKIMFKFNKKIFKGI